MHMTSVLFLVRFNNFALTMGFYWSYTLLLQLPVLMFLCALASSNTVSLAYLQPMFNHVYIVNWRVN